MCNGDCGVWGGLGCTACPELERQAELAASKSESNNQPQPQHIQVGDHVRVRANQGYWDITHYPRGGSFKRGKVEWSGLVTELYPEQHEAKLVVRSLGHMPDNYFVVKVEALTKVEV